MTLRYYVGYEPYTGKASVFRSTITPTEATHGERFASCTGPFRTRRGAEFMAKHGRNNPHCRCVDEAEQCAKSAHDEVTR